MFEFTDIFTIRKLESLSYRGREHSMAVLNAANNVVRVDIYLENAYYNGMTLKAIKGHRQCKILWCSCVMLC